MARGISGALSVIMTLCVAGCGRYMPKIPPEMLAPAAVDSVTTHSSESSTVTFEWRAPHDDLRGKPLKEMRGYSVVRWAVPTSLTITDRVSSIDFNEIAFIEDHRLEELKKLRDEAEAKGQITRKIKLDDAKERFSFEDTHVPEGTSFYKIIPVNDKGGPGAVKDLYKVTRAGTTVTISSLPYTLDNAKFQ